MYETGKHSLKIKQDVSVKHLALTPSPTGLSRVTSQSLLMLSKKAWSKNMHTETEQCTLNTSEVKCQETHTDEHADLKQHNPRHLILGHKKQNYSMGH